jgi:hypothetical protein
MSDEPDFETLEFRYTFSPSDDKLAFAEHNRSIRLRAALRGTLGLALAFILLMSFVAAPSFLGLWMVISVSQLIGAALIVGCVTGPVLKEAIAGGKKIREFEPLEFESTVSKEGILNRNTFVLQEAKWPAVRRIALKPYGIHFDAGPTWFIPRSAFASDPEMQSSYARIRQFMKRYAEA